MVLQDQRIVFVNVRATEILEATKDEIIKNGVLQHVHIDDKDSLAHRARQRLAGEVVSERFQIRLQLPAKPIKWLEIGDSQVPWDGGQGLLVFFLDVTQRHEVPPIVQD